MKLTFLGTGAADYDWKNYGAENILGSTMTLLGDHILLDCGPTATRAMKRFNVKINDIHAIVNTHSHSDHFNVDEVRKIANGRKIDFYGSRNACNQVADFCNVHPLNFGRKFKTGGFKFLTLPANHAVSNLKEETFNYVISDGEKNILYALDTAWMLTKARLLIGKTHLDAIIHDATMSNPDDWRIFEHSDPVMIAAIRRVLLKTNVIDENTKVYFDHRARTLWPADTAAQQAIAERENALLAIDGETVFI